jgi:hypothetical protein
MILFTYSEVENGIFRKWSSQSQRLGHQQSQDRECEAEVEVLRHKEFIFWKF